MTLCFHNMSVFLMLVFMLVIFCKSEDVLELFPAFEYVKTSTEQLKTSYEQLKTSTEQFKTSTELFKTSAQASIDKLRADVNNVQGRSAFSAFFSEAAATNSKNMADGAIFIFDKVETNIGNGYSTSTGKFTAPSTGLYAFTWTLCADSRTSTGGGYGEFGSNLMVGGYVRGRLHVDTEANADDACSTGFAIVEIPLKGYTVYIKNIYSTQGIILSKEDQGRTTFSGWKL